MSSATARQESSMTTSSTSASFVTGTTTTATGPSAASSSSTVAAAAASPGIASDASPSKSSRGKARKRKRGGMGISSLTTFSSSSSSSPSSSSEEEEEEPPQQQPQQSSSHHASTVSTAPSRNTQKRRTSSSSHGTSASQAAQSSANSSSSSRQQSAKTQQPNGWRVKLYRLNTDGSWDDCGTGRIVCLQKSGNKTAVATDIKNDQTLYQELGEPTLCMHAEQAGQPQPILLRTRILLRDAYQRQGDNIITWCEPYYDEEGNPTQGVDLALSFQDNAGCLQIWSHITQVQSRAAELYRRSSTASSNNNSNNNNNNKSNNNSSTVEDMAHAVAAAHHASLQRQQQQAMWANVSQATSADGGQQQTPQHHHHHHHHTSHEQHEQQHHDEHTSLEMNLEEPISLQSYSIEAAPNPNHNLPSPPTLANLEEIADSIAAVQHMQQRQSLALFISQNECSYLKSLLSLFPSAESRGDYGSLATLAACVKTILLLNDPSIIDLIISDELIFEEVCSTLEYDPDLRDKANHRWFLRERAKFRTVVLMTNEELVASIHRAFRVNYLRDTLLRPTMDESSLSTLSSLQTFTHADVVKGVTRVEPLQTQQQQPQPHTESTNANNNKRHEADAPPTTYLQKVVAMLGRELLQIEPMEWAQLEEEAAKNPMSTSFKHPATHHKEEEHPSTVIASGKYPSKATTTWKQHLAPQDGSLTSRRVRRRGCLSFLRELFNMVRVSLQQTDKEDFFCAIVALRVTVDKQSLTFLSLLGRVLADPNTDVTEKGSVLEIIASIAMHDAGLIRSRCLELNTAIWNHPSGARKNASPWLTGRRPAPNEKKQIVFHQPPGDLLGSILFLMAVETDAGVLLQASEVMRMILDTDMMGEHGQTLGGGFADEAEGIPPGHTPPHESFNSNSNTNSQAATSDQNQFLSMFYEHYVQWLVAPFQFTILHPALQIPDAVLSAPLQSPVIRRMEETFKTGVPQDDALLKTVPVCAIRSSFAVELLSFCVRAHLYRMKLFLLKSQVLGSVLKLLKPHTLVRNASGDRCLKLAALRFLRAILSVNDEFYHRHIIQHNLFAPVFEAFRANPIGDNLVSSAIVEMCDYIHTENIKSLIEYIVTKHLSATHSEAATPSLEDVSSPYVSTLTVLRKAYENNMKAGNKGQANKDSLEQASDDSDSNSRLFRKRGPSARCMNEKALEDQRKFREADQEESYFDADDDVNEGQAANTVVPPAVDEVAAQQVESELHRTPRMFSLTQAPLLNGPPLRVEDAKGGDGTTTNTGSKVPPLPHPHDHKEFNGLPQAESEVKTK